MQDVIMVRIYAIPADVEAFEAMSNETYIGHALIPWKECVDRAKDGVSPELSFKVELVNYDGTSNEVSGLIDGTVQWIQYGAPGSYCDAAGNDIKKSLAKTADDFKGRRVGQAGSLRVLPRELKCPYELDLSIEYAVQILLLDKAGKKT